MRFYMAGQAHNEVDQRFSDAAVRRCDRIETPDGFLDQIKQCVKPLRGRSQHAQILTGSFDWQDLFAAMGNIKGLITGHTQTQRTRERGEEAVHFWRFLKRGSVQIGTPIVGWPGYPEQADDVVMLIKFYVSSAETCDQLKVFLPAAVLAKLPTKPDKMPPV